MMAPPSLPQLPFLSTALENLSEGVILVDATGAILHMNAEALRVHGFERLEDLIREPKDYPARFELRDFEGELLAFEQWPINRMMRGERFQAMEVRIKHTVRGQPREWDGSYGATPIREESGRIAGGVLTVRNITEQKRIQLALEERERQFEQTFSEAHSFMAILSVPDFRYLRVNRAHTELLGGVDVTGRLITEVLPAEEASQIHGVIEQIARTGVPFSGSEVPLRIRIDGVMRTRYLNLIIQPLKDQQGNVCAMYSQGTDATDRVQSRRNIENDRQNFRALFRQTPEMVCILSGPEHTFEFVNEAHIRVLGFDATGKTVREAQPESVEVHGILDDVYRTGVTAELFEIAVTVGDRLRYFNLTYAARRDPQGTIDGIMIVGVEVTEQVLNRTRLEESEENFRLVAEAIPQIVWVSRPDGSVTYYNQRWQQHTGLTMEESVRRGMDSVIHPDDYPGVLEAWRQAHESTGFFAKEYRLRGHDGTYRWFLGRSVPIAVRDGKVEQWFGTATDIDETKRTQIAQSFLDQASLIISRSFNYKATLQKVADLAVTELADWCGVDLLNEQGGLDVVAVGHRDPTMVEFAREFRRRYPTDMTAETGVPRVIRTREPELYAEIPDELLVQGAVDETHLEMMRKLGLSSIIIVPLMIGEKVFGALTLILSTRERRYGPDDLKTARELARRAALAIENARLFSELRSAVQVRDEFLSIASHELRTPITPIKLQLQYLLRAMDHGRSSALKPDRIRAAVEASSRQLSRLTRLVDDLLDVSRITTGRLTLHRESLDLSALVAEVCDRYREQAATAKVGLQVSAPPTLTVQCDRLRIEQVLINLLVNAFKYAPGAPVQVSLGEDGGYAQLTVRDGGPGIGMENFERVFERFERLSSPQTVGGLGLGLYISRQIMVAHGGRIWVESRPQEGAAFHLELPVSPQK